MKVFCVVIRMLFLLPVILGVVSTLMTAFPAWLICIKLFDC